MQNPDPAPRSVVVMGVSGCGKSTLGAALARAAGWCFVEGDALHPPENVAKMAAGIPLSDADRAPWLRALGAEIARAQTGGPVIATCSALKRSYRDVLRASAPGLRFLHLSGDREVLEQRLSHRPGHFFPATLLKSQLATLEPLTPDEDGVTVDLDLPVEAQMRLARRLMEI